MTGQAHPSHVDLLLRWQRRVDLVRALPASYTTVQSWETRNAVPRRWWARLVEVSAAAGIGGITLDALERGTQKPEVAHGEAHR
jgi:hypothetical protein